MQLGYKLRQVYNAMCNWPEVDLLYAWMDEYKWANALTLTVAHMITAVQNLQNQSHK